MAHERAKADHADTNSLATRATMLAGGAILGIGAGTAVAMMAGITGTISSNPAVALALGVGTVVGIAAGVLFNKVSSHFAEKDCLETQQQFQSAEQQAFSMPNLSDRLLARREAVSAQVDQDQAHLRKIRIGAAAIGFGMGTMTGS